METKFKKGDRVVARMQDAFGFFKAGDEGKVEHIGTNRAKININGRAFTTTFRGIEELFDLVAKPIESPSPRLASDMTIREEIASRIYAGVINETPPSLKGVCNVVGVNESEYVAEIHFPIYCAKRTLVFADALIKALNEKP